MLDEPLLPPSRRTSVWHPALRSLRLLLRALFESALPGADPAPFMRHIRVRAAI